MTFAEIRFGIEAIGDPERRIQLNAWLAHDLRPLFEGRVVPITEDVLLRWRQVVEAGRQRGHTYSEPDVLIAAAALVERLIVASRDVREFVEAGVPVFNPLDQHILRARSEGRSCRWAGSSGPPGGNRAAV